MSQSTGIIAKVKEIKWHIDICTAIGTVPALPPVATKTALSCPSRVDTDHSSTGSIPSYMADYSLYKDPISPDETLYINKNDRLHYGPVAIVYSKRIQSGHALFVRNGAIEPFSASTVSARNPMASCALGKGALELKEALLIIPSDKPEYIK